MRVILFICVFLVTAVNFSFACVCGMEGSTGRIYGGTSVRAHKYPWIVHIRSFSDRSRSYSQCGGSLIDERHIATAAHCVVRSDGSTFTTSNIDVYLGKEKAFSIRTNVSKVYKIWVDPRYNPQDLSNDFAILSLSKSIKFTRTISPVCLPNSENGLSKLTVAGWGLGSSNSNASDTLMEVDVSYLTKAECNKIKIQYYKKHAGSPLSMKIQIRVPGVVETHMCAINSKTLGDACAGDSGGPLMKKGDGGLNYLVGVVSGSWADCGSDENIAGLYTRVAYYRETIKNIAPNACWKN